MNGREGSKLARKKSQAEKMNTYPNNTDKHTTDTPRVIHEDLLSQSYDSGMAGAVRLVSHLT
ncbi:hypothetical protein [Thiolapillus sp.]|uniref:hypothetical protein n=1 Tax=Thiolapillus sp. TaxID=2017437 RepID=UPI0025F54DB2|nr:hypothetical protein [Thiolapillus sp.]